MIKNETDQPSSLSGIITTISTGFDLTTQHLGLIIIPVLLDLLLWLGPRLSGRALIQNFIDWQQQLPTGTFSEEMLEVSQAQVELLTEIAPRVNLLGQLRVPFIGVPTLTTGLSPENVPLEVTVWPIEAGTAVGLILAFMVIGVALSTIYLSLIGQVTYHGRVQIDEYVVHLPNQLMQVGALIGTFILCLFVIYLPLAVLLTVAMVLSASVAMLLQLVGFMLTVWLLVYFSFSLHGILIYHRTFWRSLWDSLRLVQRYMFSVIILFTTIMVINTGLSFLWGLADSATWLMLASILGHSFISTGLVMATFIFYQERIEALSETLETA